MKKRVVVTGMGVIAPNAHGVKDFSKALRRGLSGIRYIEQMKEAGFACCVGGVPQGWKEKLELYFSEERRLAMNELLAYGCMASVDAWKDAGLTIPGEGDDNVDWDCGAIIGLGQSDTESIRNTVYKIDAKQVRRLGSTVVEKSMTSAPTARISGILGLGGQATTVSSACATGTDAINTAARLIRDGYTIRMVAGGLDTSSLINWGGFDSMKVLNRNSNENPERASRPMSSSAAGFVPGSGAGIIILEELESALKRGVRIYAEWSGGSLNGGGHRNGGSMTFPGKEGVVRAIKSALADANVQAGEIDAINGHLTGTIADPIEVKNWSETLNLRPESFPLLQSTKSMIGHCLGAAGGIEAVASIVQLHEGFLHPSINCEDVHPELEKFNDKIIRKATEKDIKYIAKSSFGFGDVNAISIWKKWSPDQ